MQRATVHFVILVAAVGLVAVGAWWALRARGPDPPAPADPGAVDPEVAALVRKTTAAVRADLGNAALRARLGMVYEANGLIDLARRSYEQALAIDGSQPRWWYRLAIVRARLGDLRGAIEISERVIALSGDYAPAHWRHGLWLLDQGDLKEAEASFRRATETDPADPAGWIGLARIFLERRENQPAADVLESLLSRRPGDRYALQLLGTAYSRLGRADDARPALAAGVTGEPVWSDPWSDEVAQYQRGFAAVLKDAAQRYLAGQLDVAMTELEGLRQKKPHDVLLLDHLGAIYVAAGRTDEGLQVLNEALAENPDRVETHLNLALAYLQKENLDRARVYADRAIALSPALAKVHETKGMILWRSRQFDPAIAAFRTALRYDPRDLAALLGIGMIDVELNRSAEALASFERALDQDPTLADAYVGIGMVKMNEGALDEADAALGRAAQLNPDSPRLKDAQARLQERLKGGRRR